MPSTAMARISGTRATVTGVVAFIPAGLGAFFAVAAQSETSPSEDIWSNAWMWAAVGCWIVAVAIVAVGLLGGSKRGTPARAQSPKIEDEAVDLARELLAFYEPWVTALPPLEYVQVGRAPPGALEEWRQRRDAAILDEYHRVSDSRVRRVYEALRAKRGYGHPLMEGRYDNVRREGESSQSRGRWVRWWASRSP